MLSSQASLFSLDNDVTYLNCAYMSPQLKAVEQASLTASVLKNNPWKMDSALFFDPCEEARKQVATLLSARADDIAIIASASYGIASAAQNITLEAGETILCLEEQFPSNVYTWLELAKEKKATVQFVKRHDTENWTAAILRSIDSSTRVLAVPNVHWADGRKIDLKAISRAIQKTKIQLILDLTQSLGAMPISVKEVDADFIVSSAYKWLLGPYGLGFMYVKPKHQEGKPIEHNWINRKGSQNFAELVNYQTEFAYGARRFDVGERSHFQLMPLAVEALKQINQWRVEAIADYTQSLTNLLAQELELLDFKPQHADERSHITGIEFKTEVPQQLLKKLKDEKIFISVRGRSIRVSPHLYNTEADIKALVQALR